MINNTSEKIEQPIGDYMQTWDTLQPERKIDGTYFYGSRNHSKMVEFLKQTYFGRDALKHYMSFGPARAENETYPDYKVRQRFQQALAKYKHTVKQGTFVNTIELIQRKQKENESTGDSNGNA